jgi:hypothetical protein
MSGRQSAATVSNCGSCKYLDVKPDALGRVVVRKQNSYQCLAPQPDQPPLPTSVLKRYGWEWPPLRTYMEGTDGKDCAVFVRRESGNGR